jgi:hypothetical protein
MTKAELLAATNNVWEVKCYRDGNRRRRHSTQYVRASDVLRAEAIARQISGCKCVDASPWDPSKDRTVYRYVVTTNNN